MVTGHVQASFLAFPARGEGTEKSHGPEGNDYRLAEGSTGIDAGNNNWLPADLTTDANGNPRIVNDTVDMGACEYF